MAFSSGKTRIVKDAQRPRASNATSWTKVAFLVFGVTYWKCLGNTGRRGPSPCKNLASSSKVIRNQTRPSLRLDAIMIQFLARTLVTTFSSLCKIVKAIKLNFTFYFIITFEPDGIMIQFLEDKVIITSSRLYSDIKVMGPKVTMTLHLTLWHIQCEDLKVKWKGHICKNMHSSNLSDLKTHSLSDITKKWTFLKLGSNFCQVWSARHVNLGLELSRCRQMLTHAT